MFTFIQADLSSFRPKPRPEYANGFADASISGFDPVAPSEPIYPKSLYLLQPLFSSYELNPVAPEAQASVAIPEGLDLDAWIVPQAKPAVDEPAAEVGVKKKKKGGKGKGKERDTGDGSGKSKKSGKKKAGVTVPELTQEEIAEAEERARVCFILTSFSKIHELIS